MRIVSYNVNGIRAAVRKGFLDWLKSDPADVICLQEIKANEEDIDKLGITEAGYPYQYYFCAQKKGYSGVAILSKIEPAKVIKGSGHEVSDSEGRILQVDFDKFRLINAYFPSGTSGVHRQTYKYQWLKEFLDYLKKLKETHSQLVLCGDYNIAHKEIDIHNPAASKKTTGFLPEERAWFDAFLLNGFIDGFRHLNKDPYQYTWWNVLRPQTRIDNKGWRIDYINVTENMQNKIVAVKIFPDVKHSDHCPIFLELKS